jgi:hypothetical protein
MGEKKKNLKKKKSGSPAMGNLLVIPLSLPYTKKALIGLQFDHSTAG